MSLRRSSVLCGLGEYAGEVIECYGVVDVLGFECRWGGRLVGEAPDGRLVEPPSAERSVVGGEEVVSCGGSGAAGVCEVVGYGAEVFRKEVVRLEDLGHEGVFPLLGVDLPQLWVGRRVSADLPSCF